jgi:hypothetical protein
MDNSFLGIENAVNSATTFRRNYTTPTPSQQTGYEATYLRDQHLGKRWRGATADVRYTPLLARFDDVYRIGALGGLGHNLSPSATWHATLGTTGVRPAVRPVLITDGIDDKGISGDTIPAVTNYTILYRGYLPAPGINSEAAGVPIFRLMNTASGNLARVSVGAANSAAPLQLFLFASHYGTPTVFNTSAVRPGGEWFDMWVRYRTSDHRVDWGINGVEIGNGTAPALTGAEGAFRVELSTLNGTSFLPAWHQSLHIYGRRFGDAEVQAYSHSILTGSERDLVEGFNFTEGTGNPAGVKGTTTITLTGGTWRDVANPFPAHSAGMLEAIGQWYRRQALRIGTGTVITSPSLGTATRDLTVSFTVRCDDDHITGSDTPILAIGPSAANAEALLNLIDGVIDLTSFRGTPDTVTGSSIRGLGLARGRATLVSVDSTSSNLSLWMATGANAETLVGTVAVGPYDAVAACLLQLGDVNAGGDNSNCIFGEVRYFGALRLEADDDLLGPCDLSDPALIECLVLDSEVVSEVDPTRVFTTASLTYESIDNPNVTRSAPGREGLGYPYTSGRGQIEAELLDFVANADVEVSEIFLEIWDRKNADGYVSLGTLCCWATFRPDENRVTGSERTWKMRKAMRTDVGGIPYLEDAYEAPVGKISLKYLDIIDEQDEVYRRVLRARRDKLVLLATEPRRLVGQTKTATPQHLFVDYFVAGTLTPTTETIKEGNERHVEIDLEVEGVRRQTA